MAKASAMLSWKTSGQSIRETAVMTIDSFQGGEKLLHFVHLLMSLIFAFTELFSDMVVTKPQKGSLGF